MQTVKAPEECRNEIIHLLQSNNLPWEDLPSSLNDFYAVIDEGKIVGLIGMERYAHYGLLRSMVVHAGYRNRLIAENLVQLLEQSAAISGIRAMYLLTETAEKYFSKRNYKVIARSEVPQPLFQSSEFSHVCPVSATVMKKDLENQIVSAVP